MHENSGEAEQLSLWASDDPLNPAQQSLARYEGWTIPVPQNLEDFSELAPNLSVEHREVALRGIIRRTEDRSDTVEAFWREKSERNNLTKLYNLDAFADRIQARLHDKRQNGTTQPGTLLFIDLDHLNVWNDIYTEPGVNKLILMPLAEILSESVRDTDLVAHWGGDEFAIYVDGMSYEDAQRFAETLRARINAIVTAGAPADGPQFVGASIGLTSLHTGESYTDAEIRAARAKSYGKRELGRNEIVNFDDIPNDYDFNRLSRKARASLASSQIVQEDSAAPS